MNVYDKPLYDDFTGFTFNGKHSSEFGLLRISDGDRYEDTFVLPHSNEAADIPGGPGQYYWGEQTKQREFKVRVAYDNIGEVEKRRIRQWLHPDGKLHELIFDERPYVKYWVKCAKEVVTEELCFNEYDITKSTTWPYDTIKTLRRVYKGEFEIQFVAYMPYGLAVSKNLNCFAPGGDLEAPNYNEWAESSGLRDSKNNFDQFSNNNFANIYNPGDIPSGFELNFKLDTLSKITATEVSDNGERNVTSYILTLDKTPQEKTYYIESNGNFIKISDAEGTFEILNNEPIKFLLNNGTLCQVYESINLKYTYLAEFSDDINFNDIEKKIIGVFINNKYEQIIIESNIIESNTVSGQLFFSFPDNRNDIKIQNLSIPQIGDTHILFTLGLNGTEENRFEFKIPDSSNTSPENWSEAQKLRFYGGSVKINTDKKTVSWNKDDSETWVGISEAIIGDLFKIPNSLDIRTFGFSIDKNCPQTITDISITYPYLYI